MKDRITQIRRALEHPQHYDGDIGADIRWLLSQFSDAGDGNQQERSVAVDPAAPRTVDGSTRDPECSSCVRLRSALQTATEELFDMRSPERLALGKSLIDGLIARAEVAEAKLQTAEQEREKALKWAATHSAEVTRLDAKLSALLAARDRLT